MTEFVCMIHQASLRWPRAQAVVFGDQSLSYRELNHQVQRAAQSLQAFQSSTTWRRPVSGSLDDVIQLLAAQRLGQCVLPLNPQLPEAWLNNALQGLATQHWPAPEPNDAWDSSYTLPQPVPAHQAAHWILTSGTTGTPKVAVLTLGNHRYSATGSLWLAPSQPGDRYWLSLPLFHVGGLSQLYRCFMSGATLVVPHQTLSAALIKQLHISHLSLVPTQLQRLLDEPDADLSGIKRLLLGGGPAPQDLLDRAQHLPIQTTYGLTEMASQVVTRQPDGRHRLLPYRQLTLSPEGEIWVKGHTLFAGYQTPSGLVSPVDLAGWFHTRDTGHWDGQRLHINGRLDNQFISGGENLQPESLERIALQFSGIRQAIVVPVSDEEFGQRPVLFIEGSCDKQQFLAWYHRQIPRHAKPKALLSLPELSGLKINRTALQQQAERAIHGNLA